MPSQLSGLEKRHVHVRGRAVRVEQNNRDGKRREHGKTIFIRRLMPSF